MDKAAYAADVLTFACRHVLGEKGSGMQEHAWEVQQLKEELAQRSASRSWLTGWRTFLPAPP